MSKQNNHKFNFKQILKKRVNFAGIFNYKLIVCVLVANEVANVCFWSISF